VTTSGDGDSDGSTSASDPFVTSLLVDVLVSASDEDLVASTTNIQSSGSGNLLPEDAVPPVESTVAGNDVGAAIRLDSDSVSAS